MQQLNTPYAFLLNLNKITRIMFSCYVSAQFGNRKKMNTRINRHALNLAVMVIIIRVVIIIHSLCTH